MEKAFDAKVLAAKLKARGLDVAEEAAKILVEEVLAWTEESVNLTENKFDDMLLVVLPQVKSYALAQVDKINGKEG